MSSDNLQTALDYLNRHWSVIPVAARDKRPIVPWLEFQRRRASEDEVTNWYRRWPEANVGIVTGVVSGLVVLDIDSRHGGDASLDALLKEHGSLPRTVEAVTGSGGRHIYFAHPGCLIRNKVGMRPGIDVRGDGGCIVAPPSVHPCGASYFWREDRSPNEAPLATMPEWLLEAIVGAGRRGSQPLDYWRTLVQSGVEQGARNSAIASLSGHLLWHEVAPDVVMELLLCWNRARCRPPLDDDEVVRTVHSITRLHEQEER